MSSARSQLRGPSWGCIIAWTCATAGLTFVVVDAIIGMRVSKEVEEEGIDVSEHGQAFDGPPTTVEKVQMVTEPVPMQPTAFMPSQPMMAPPGYPPVFGGMGYAQPMRMGFP